MQMRRLCLTSILVALHSGDVNPQIDYHETPHRTNEFEKPSQRGSRFLTFNNDVSNIRLEMVFAVPFLQIPIGGKQSDNSPTPVVDVNVKSLIAASTLMFMLFFVIPRLVRVFVPQVKTSKVLDNNLSFITSRLDEALQTHDIDVASCTTKTVCWIAKSLRHTPSIHILSNFIKLGWLKSLTGVHVEGALRDGASGGDCEAPVYAKCSVTTSTVTSLVKCLTSAVDNR